MKDEMEKDIAEEAGAEASAQQSFEEMMATMKNDLEDTQEALVEDTKFLADLKKTCAIKAKEWEIICKTRKEELIALADVIKILSDDDALELFKKTLPSPSLLQMTVTSKEARQQALLALKSAHGAHGHRDPRLDLIALALRGHTA